jgi:hypothetical protein
MSISSRAPARPTLSFSVFERGAQVSVLNDWFACRGTDEGLTRPRSLSGG